MKIMKNHPSFLLAVPFLVLTVAASAIASDAPRVPRTTLAAAEKSLDTRFAGLWSDNPFIMLGPTRGIYLEGYGTVFTAEVNLVAGPQIGILTPSMTKQSIAQHRQKKIDRIPELKKAMLKALADTAASPEMAAAVNNAVTKAVADTEKRDDQRTAQLLSASDQRYSDAADFLNKQVTRIYALNTGAGVR